jgi:hypothetical protein
MNRSQMRPFSIICSLADENQRGSFFLPAVTRRAIVSGTSWIYDNDRDRLVYQVCGVGWDFYVSR